MFKFLDPSECQNVSLPTFDRIKYDFALKFDAEAVKMEYREFAIDFEINVNIGDALQFWLTVKSMKFSMGDSKYLNLSMLAMQLFSVPASNDDCKRIFSIVRRIKTISLLFAS